MTAKPYFTPFGFGIDKLFLYLVGTELVSAE